MNFSTFFMRHPGICTFRLLGFGVLIFHEGVIHMFPSNRARLWLIPVWPEWKFALVAPWT